MLNKIETPNHHNFEMHRTTDGKTVESYANGIVKVHDGHNSRTTIDIHNFNTHVVINKFGPFEFNKIGEIDDVYVRKGHHKGRFAAAFSDKKNGAPYEYDVWSPEGIIGSARGKRLDLLIASLFFDDPKLKEATKDCSMDDTVKRYLKFALITAGTNIHLL